MFVEWSVSGEPLDGNGKQRRTPKDTSPAEQFLVAHESAKIVVIVDTHCIESGFFVWTGEGAADWKACSLLEVSMLYRTTCFIFTGPSQILRDCTPPGIFKYLSNAPDAPKHNHTSLIVNLACGASISQVAARSELLDG